MSIKVSNQQADMYVTDRQDFMGNNTFSIDSKKTYSVFSYGVHFPIYVYVKRSKRWYGNADKYSRTTSKHQSQLRPNVGDITYISTKKLKEKIKYSFD